MEIVSLVREISQIGDFLGGEIMLVVLMEEQILSPKQVCQNCLLADRRGLPRWRKGHLGCGHTLRGLTDQQPELYECEMGFRLARLNSTNEDTLTLKPQ